MSKIKANALLSQYIYDLNQLSEIVHTKFGSLTLKQLNWKPSPKKWSVAECLEHIYIVDGLYLEQMRDKIAKGKEAKQAYQSGIMGRMMIKSMKNRIIIAKTFAIMTPTQSSYDETVITNILNRFKEMKAIVEDARAVNIQKIKIVSVASSWIRVRLGDHLGFLIAHDERHINQALELLKNDNFPQ